MPRKRRRVLPILAVAVGILAVFPSAARALDWARFSVFTCYHAPSNWTRYLGSLAYYNTSSTADLVCPIRSGAVSVGYEGTTIDRVHVHVYDARSDAQLSAHIAAQSPWNYTTWDNCWWTGSGNATVGNTTIVLDDQYENCVSNDGYFVFLEIQPHTWAQPLGIAEVVGYAVGF